VQIDLTNDEYRRLLELAYLGEWVVNSNRSPTENIKEYDDLLKSLFSYAEEAGLEDFAQYYEEEKAHFPSPVFEDETSVREFLEEYNDDTFWAELIDRLAWRDAAAEVGEERLERMQDEERGKKLGALENKYADLLEKQGLDCLAVKSK